MNVIVITVDTLRYDYIGAHGNNWIRTPNLDRLAAESWVFHNSYTSSYPTIPHRTDAFTGKSGSPFHPWVPLAHDEIALPRALAEAGYATQLLHDTPHLVNGGHNFDWPFNAWTFVRGAEVDRRWITGTADEPANWARDPLFDPCDHYGEVVGTSYFYTYARANKNRKKDEDWNCARLFLTASQWLQDNAGRDNFFLWLDCFDPHEPWDVPPEYMLMYDKTPGYDGRIDPRMIFFRYAKELSDDARNRIAASYAAKVTWMDRWLGELLDTLERSGLAKNTAVLLTADHGTNVGERGREAGGGGFGKGHPVRELEAHTPFIVRLPDGDAGRSDILVQPMDIFATVMGIVGEAVPEGLDSVDVLAQARSGKPGTRQVAVAGNGVMNWGKKEGILFTVLDGRWCLEYAAKPEGCALTPMGSLEDVAPDNQDVVDRLRKAGVEELERRGTDPAIIAWLRSNGEGEYPTDCKFWDRCPAPAGYASYFTRLYDRD